MDSILFLEKFYHSSGIPISIYEEQKLIHKFDNDSFLPDPAWNIIAPVLASHSAPFYTISPDFLLCGILPLTCSAKQWLLIGPAPLADCNRTQAQNILYKLGQSASRTNQLLHWLGTLPTCSVHQFKDTIHFLDYALNGTTADNLQQLTILSNADVKLPSVIHEPHIESLYDKEFVTKIYDYIKYGNYRELKILLDNIDSWNMNMPDFSNDAVRSFKNIFIYSTVMGAYMAEQGGADYRLTSQLSEKYLSLIEPLHSYHEISKLWQTVLIDFAKRAAQSRIVTSSSVLVTGICKDVQAHIYERISAAEIAGRLKMSPEHLSREFKKHTGKTITSYIQECKTQEAKRLLKTTDLTLSQIAAMLSFSSQHYFHTVFKKHMNMTPWEYRCRIIED